MQLINDIEQLKNALEKGGPVLIYFSGESCSVCQSLKPKIATAIADNFSRFEIYQVQADCHREIASQFMVFSIPTILVYFDNKEFFRHGGNMSVATLLEQIERPYQILAKKNAPDLER